MISLRQQLLTLIADVQRLVPAGAAAAAHDERLQQRVESLEQWVPQVPALGPVIESLRGVFRRDRIASTQGFLSLISSVRQIWALLTGSGVNGKVEPVEQQVIWNTSTPSASLYNITEVLRKRSATTSQVLERAFTKGHATDLRLLEDWLDCAPHRREQTKRFMKALLPRCGPLLVEGLRARLASQKHENARPHLLHLICNIDAEAGVECCRKAIEEGKPDLRVHALQHYVMLAPVQAQETAVTLLGPSQPVNVRAEAVRVLYRRRIPSVKFAALLEKNLTDAAGWQVCREARLTLTSAGKPTAEVALKVLTSSLDSASGQVRGQCAETVGKMGRYAVPVVPRLIDVLLNEQERFHSMESGPKILTALTKIGQPLRPIVEALFGYEEQWRTWHGASMHWQRQWSEQRLRNGLLALSKKNPETVAIIAEKCRTPQWMFRREVLEVFRQLGPGAAVAVPCLTELVPDRAHRDGAIRALGQIGPPACVAMPALREALEATTMTTRVLSALAQVRIGVQDEVVVPVLLHALQSKGCLLSQRREVAEALGMLGVLARSAVPALRRITRRPRRDQQLRAICERAIQKITGNAR